MDGTKMNQTWHVLLYLNEVCSPAKKTRAVPLESSKGAEMVTMVA
jgi:hypothetical protein